MTLHVEQPRSHSLPSLPGSAHEANGTPQSHSAKPDLYCAGEVHILILDDDPAIGLFMQTALARNDFEFVVSALRAANLRTGSLDLKDDEDGKPRGNPLTFGAMTVLTQKLWLAPSPKGWPDDPGFWLAPASFARRLRWIPALVRHMADTDPAGLIEAALGPLATANTIATVKSASNRLEALGLIFASPEFNRR